ncbi:hypothetical protein Pelo_18661 [Pelomyxa schiedti]|nr:hypothetical protein Pelo_18661 [Pelomyxa schiedti]
MTAFRTGAAAAEAVARGIVVHGAGGRREPLCFASAAVAYTGDFRPHPFVTTPLPHNTFLYSVLGVPHDFRAVNISHHFQLPEKSVKRTCTGWFMKTNTAPPMSDVIRGNRVFFRPAAVWTRLPVVTVPPLTVPVAPPSTFVEAQAAQVQAQAQQAQEQQAQEQVIGQQQAQNDLDLRESDSVSSLENSENGYPLDHNNLRRA